MSLPKVHRLRLRRAFSAVYQVGSRQSGPSLTLRALRLNSSAQMAVKVATDPTQIGISISQKVSKRAVVRNRIKRQLKAIFRDLLPQVAAGWQLVIVVKPSATQCSYEQFLQELKQLLCRAKVINER